MTKNSGSDPYSLNLDPDTAKNLNLDLDPVPDPNYFLPVFEKKLNYFIIIRFYHQKESIE